jgi:hypothetical protein
MFEPTTVFIVKVDDLGRAYTRGDVKCPTVVTVKDKAGLDELQLSLAKWAQDAARDKNAKLCAAFARELALHFKAVDMAGACVRSCDSVRARLFVRQAFV